MGSGSKSLATRIKTAALPIAAAGMLYGSACTLADVRLNLVNGSLGFVKGYASDVWEALVPPADELFGEQS